MRSKIDNCLSDFKIKDAPKKIKIENAVVGDGMKSFIIGEVGSNHNRDKNVVRQLIDAAAEAKFDAVKFQVYDPEEAFSKNVTTTDVGLEYMYGKKPWWEIARDRILMPREWFEEMFDYVREKGLIPFSTVHRIEDINFLLKLGVGVFKIASIDCNHLPLLKEVAKCNKPLIISTGMARIEEIDETIKMLVEAGNKELIILHCVSCYPPKPEVINLRNIAMFEERYGFPVGYSDHSISNAFTLAALALGSCVVEKHITLDRKMEGPDHFFALEPKDMIDLVKSVRETESALGKEKRILFEDELAIRRMVRRSIVAQKNIKKDEVITPDMVKFARPGEGISPNLFKEEMEGRKANKDISAEEIISWDMIR
ncbi:MAG: N-acetylneuraminate synthase family protein [Candidatus Omnitrophica bacterium]|nr:N-acetylneuraminate synthase family protein [Candidatus Omnitrophota bacterium]